MSSDTLKKRIYELHLEARYKFSKTDDALFKLYQNFAGLRYVDSEYDIEKVKSDFYEFIKDVPAEKRLEVLDSADCPYVWGMFPKPNSSKKILNKVYDNLKVYFGEDAFLRCIVGTAQLLPQEQKHYQTACGYIIDDLTAYFDATRTSRMEKIINSDFEIIPEQLARSKKVIAKIIDNKISKYNNQPIYEPKIGRDGVPKVLVIDQSYNDYSIIKGCADDSTFKNMLEAAIRENPDADIIIKTHPDTIGKDSIKPKCYYQNVSSHDNIYRITDAINPISMIQYVDKVYVCTSQFGFESLMCGKEVHIFGMPFYAGWGLTIDAQKCERRTRTRTLEELFYIAYIHMPVYINPLTNKRCEIEEVLDYLIAKRTEYFEENNIRYD